VFRQFDPDALAAAFRRPLAAGVLDEDAAHGLGGGGEEMPAAVEPLPVADQPEVRLVDQGRGLQGVVGGLACHPDGRQLPQLVVDEREELGGRVPVAGRGGVEEPGDVIHPARITRRQPGEQVVVVVVVASDAVWHVFREASGGA
jgi:hypothetical protein